MFYSEKRSIKFVRDKAKKDIEYFGFEDVFDE